MTTTAAQYQEQVRIYKLAVQSNNVLTARLTQAEAILKTAACMHPSNCSLVRTTAKRYLRIAMQCNSIEIKKGVSNE